MEGLCAGHPVSWLSVVPLDYFDSDSFECGQDFV